MMKLGRTLYFFWRLKYIVLFVIIFLSVAAAFMVTQSWLSGDNTEQESEAFVEHIRDMNALATSQAFVKAVVEQTDNQLFGQNISINLPGTQRSLLLIVPGTVLAGVDLDSIEEEDIVLDEEAKTIEITIPRADFLQEPAIDMENVQAFSVEGVFRSNVNWEEGFEIASEAQKIIKEEAETQGILVQAENNAERALQQFFEYAGYKATITFEES
ncbi:DUF4230 domain-containing protein [Jeotgalibacillus proteolyticus]|uniref:DUF4230 domain-containing protein n=1 Tax=Jeotgalibacillus proteolyticus TaxID=2082395 RepID=A0A2S5G9V6_9BACL|nr:DUF4230 domain-containing protein [Jeotgalibacillus proteolyticus]PPA69705.1 hypothetical protein C4B60_14280 [Jeotgalibacillus proteolyticus]